MKNNKVSSIFVFFILFFAVRRTLNFRQADAFQFVFRGCLKDVLFINKESLKREGSGGGDAKRESKFRS